MGSVVLVTAELWRHLAVMDCAVPVSEVVPKNKQNTGADGGFTLPSSDKTHWMLDKGLLKQTEEGCLSTACV